MKFPRSFRRSFRNSSIANSAIWPAIIILVALMSTGCSQGSSNVSPGRNNFQAGTSVVIPPHLRKFPVSLVGSTWHGQRLDVATWRGHPLVLNIWASWCSPCREEAPALLQAYQALKPQGVNFVGIDAQDTSAGAADFTRQFQITYPSFVSKPSIILSLSGAVSPNAIPTTLVLDSDGRIAGRIVGALDAKTLVSMVRAVDARARHVRMRFSGYE